MRNSCCFSSSSSSSSSSSIFVRGSSRTFRRDARIIDWKKKNWKKKNKNEKKKKSLEKNQRKAICGPGDGDDGTREEKRSVENAIDDVVFAGGSLDEGRDALPVEAEIVQVPSVEEEEFASETKTSLNDYDEWQKNTSKEARKKWNDVSKRNGEETTFKVGRQDVDEKFLSEVLLYLFKSNDQKVPAHLFLNKIKRSMTLDGYKAILVGCGRANKWELCEQIIDFVKKENKEDQKDASLDGIVTANWFVAIIDARIKEKSFADVASCFEKMFEFKCHPSGAAIESFARFTDFEYEFDEELKERTRDIYEWLVDTDAGKALWPTYFGEAGVDNLPGKNAGNTKTIRVAMEALDVDLGGDIEKLQDKLSDFY